MPQAYINYYLESLKELERFAEGISPSFLLHACCGPCSCFPLTFLCPHFEVTIYFNNSNIYPSNEYERRLGRTEEVPGLFRAGLWLSRALIVTPYDNEPTTKILNPMPLCPKAKNVASSAIGNG
jgi:hypothetical protein